MKHKTHRIASLDIFLITALILIGKYNMLDLCVSTTFVAYITWKFSTLPDYIESLLRIKHRTWAHSLITYFFLVSIFYIPKQFLYTSLLQQFNIDDYYFNLLYDLLYTSLIIGWGSHLLLDALSDNGIPALFPISKSRMQLYKLSSYNNDDNEQTIVSVMYIVFIILVCVYIYILVSNFSMFWANLNPSI